MDELRQGYTGFRDLESKAIRGGMAPKTVRVPVMPVHAARPDSKVAECGELLAAVSDEPWDGGRGMYEWCRQCTTLAPRS